MAIQNIRESGKMQSSSSRDEKGRVTVTMVREFTATSNDANDTTEHVKAYLRSTGVTATGELIREGGSWPLNPSIKVDGIDCDKTAPIFYTLKVKYKSLPFRTDDGGEEPTDPELQPPDISFDTVSSEEEIDTDVNGDPIENACREPYTGVKRQVSDLQISIGKTFLIFDPATFYGYFDSVNSDTFMNFPPGVCLVRTIRAAPLILNEYLYWKINVVIQVRKPFGDTPTEKAWYERRKHEGFYCFTNESPDKPVRRKDANGHDCTIPLPLTEVGFAASVGEEGSWKYFQKYLTVAFSGMNMGV